MCTLWSATNLKSCKALSLFTSQRGNQRAQQEKHKHPSPSPRLCFLADMQLRNVNTVVNQCTHTTSYFSMLLLTTTAEPVKKKNEKAVVLKSQVGRLVLSSGHEGFKQPNKTKPMKVFKGKTDPASSFWVNELWSEYRVIVNKRRRAKVLK